MSMGVTLKLGSLERSVMVDGKKFDLNEMTKDEENKFRRLFVQAFRIKKEGAK